MPIRFFKQIHESYPAVSGCRVPESLRGLVEGIYRFTNVDLQQKQLLFNDGHPALICMPVRDRRTRMTVAGTTEYRESVWGCAGMLKHIYWEPDTEAGEEILVIRFHPAAFYQCVSLDAGSFDTRPVFDLSELSQAACAVFPADYYGSADPEARFGAVCRFLERLQAPDGVPPLLRELLAYVGERKGNLTVRDLVNRYNLRINPKWLERNFRRFTRLSPQQYIQLHRFLHAYLDLDRDTPDSVLTVALRHGYHDDRHLNRHFRRYAGMSPRAYFRLAAAGS